MSLSDPVNKMIQYNGLPVRVIGVIKNLLMESPYTRVKPTVFLCSHQNAGVLLMKLNPRLSPSAALAKLEPVFKSFKPESLFETQFVDMEYNLKFQNEERIKTLAAFFAVLAVLISCLGLFGLASFVAEQRTKEIGVRKVLGASVFRIWKMLSKEFVYMVLIACFIAIPIAWYFLTNWLNQYEYRTTLSWWLFALAIAATLFVTLLTVSFQAIKAALANPVKSLRTE
jgi:ABC-type lipoprotein release transport system permease subunit